MVVMQLEVKVSLHPGNWHIEFQRWRFGRWFSISMRGDLCRFHVSFQGKPKEPYRKKTNKKGVHNLDVLGLSSPDPLKPRKTHAKLSPFFGWCGHPQKHQKYPSKKRRIISKVSTSRKPYIHCQIFTLFWSESKKCLSCIDSKPWFFFQ